MFRTIVNSRRVPNRCTYLILNLYHNPDLNLNPDLDLNPDLERVLDLDLDLNVGLDLDLDLGLDLELELDLGICIWGRSGMDLGGSGWIQPARFWPGSGYGSGPVRDRFWSGSGSDSGPVRDPVLARFGPDSELIAEGRRSRVEIRFSRRDPQRTHSGTLF